jgi:protease II
LPAFAAHSNAQEASSFSFSMIFVFELSALKMTIQPSRVSEPFLELAVAVVVATRILNASAQTRYSVSTVTCRVRDDAADLSRWDDWLPTRTDEFVEGVALYKNFVVVSERHDCIRRLRVSDIASSSTAHYFSMTEAV